WVTALHTFTYTNAVHQSMRRAPTRDLLRGVLDGAMSVYLDRFLNIPAAPLPDAREAPAAGDAMDELASLLDRQRAVDDVGPVVAGFLLGGGSPDSVAAALGGLMLREDRDFHVIQMTEAALTQQRIAVDAIAGDHMLLAGARYLAAHSPTARAQEQTYT